MAKKYSEMSDAERQQFHNQNAAPLQVQTQLLSSEMRLEVGLEVLSVKEFENWIGDPNNRAGLSQLAKEEVYTSEQMKESNKIKAELAKKGIEIVDDRKKIKWEKAPSPWEIESFKSNDRANFITVTLRKRKDEYSFDRLHVSYGDLCKSYTMLDLNTLVEREMERIKSVWAVQAKKIRQRDIDTKAEKTVEEVKDVVGTKIAQAATFIAESESLSKHALAERMRESDFRQKFLSSKQLIESAKNFR